MIRLNRYAKKRRHKRKMKQQHMLKCGHGRAQSLRRFEQRMRDDAEQEKYSYWYRKHPPRNGGYEYWKLWYLSNDRRHCKRTTDRKIRSMYKQIIHRRDLDPEDVEALRGSDYEKIFDYWWEIY